MIQDPDKLYSSYINLIDRKDEEKILYFEKFHILFESLEPYRYLHCYIIYIESLLELNEYDEIDQKLDTAILTSLDIRQKERFETIYSILLFHKAQVKFLKGNTDEAKRIMNELLKIKEPDEATINLLFHITATPTPRYIERLHNASVILMLITALLLIVELFQYKSFNSPDQFYLKIGIALSFFGGLFSAFCGDLFHYLKCKLLVKRLVGRYNASKP